jgi:hypothetical protein
LMICHPQREVCHTLILCTEYLSFDCPLC